MISILNAKKIIIITIIVWYLYLFKGTAGKNVAKI